MMMIWIISWHRDLGIWPFGITISLSCPIMYICVQTQCQVRSRYDLRFRISETKRLSWPPVSRSYLYVFFCLFVGQGYWVKFQISSFWPPNCTCIVRTMYNDACAWVLVMCSKIRPSGATKNFYASNWQFAQTPASTYLPASLYVSWSPRDRTRHYASSFIKNWFNGLKAV